MKKSKKLGRKIFAVLMALAIVLTGLPQSAFTGIDKADAASTGISGSLESKRLLDYDFKTSRYMQIYWVDYQEPPTLLKNGSCTEASSPMHVYNINTGDAVDPIVFCVEHGVTQKNTTNMKAKDWRTSKITRAYEDANKDYVINNIFRVLFYGPVKRSNSELFDLGFKESKYYGNNGKSESDYTFASWVAATQCLVWECQQVFRDEDFKRDANGLSYQTGFHGSPTSKIPADHYTNIIKGTPAIDIYNFMASEIKKDIRFDTMIASLNKDKPTEIKIEDGATFPYSVELSGTSNGGDLKVLDEKGKEIKGITINFNKDTKKYTLTVQDESLLEKTFTVKHWNKAAQRAEKYTKGANKKYYNRYFWEYATNGGASHTQGFVSGLDDPTSGYLKLTKTPPPTKRGTCEPLDVDVFPTINMPIEKIDANTGFDGDNHTPMGDAALDAVATLERQIAGGGWETIDVQQFDEFGSEIVFTDQPFASAAALSPFMTESGSLSSCDHPIYAGDPPAIVGYQHVGSKSPTKREWDVTVNYRITITRPDGRYIDPDIFGGIREYTLKYKAETHDTCTYWCHSDPWTPVQYKIDWGATTGEGSMYNTAGTSVTDGGPIDNEPQLDCDLETDVEDVFRGRFHLIKSNEKENPFKDSALGGSDSNMSRGTLWTIRLKSKGYEASEYVHLVSTTPTKLADGTNVYTVSRGPGVVNNEQNPIKVGTNGALLVEDLPYGEYIVTEVGTDDPMYVPEQFIVVISEHNGDGAEARVKYQDRGAVPLTGKWANYNRTGTNGIGGSAAGTGDYYNNLYQVNLRDKIKTNQIQLQKVDSETGKIVRLAGTKVFIRYKGNPDYSDAENQLMFGPTGTVAKNTYNRFLPNAESINSASTNYTFELDENGCFNIPYQLPYGKYEIYEWLLPEGYYVGEYDETGTAKNHNFGFIDEGQFTVDANTHGFNGTVPSYAIKDAAGNRVEYKDKSEYSFENLTEMVTNRYTFTVTKQDMHIDGNYSELVTYNGNLRTDADPTYDKGDYPFTNYYKVAAVINNAVKGKIVIDKEGEDLVGFVKEVKYGRTVFTPIYEAGKKLKDAVFGIFAGEDINLKDGSDGPAIYDSKTGELITIPKTKSSHLSNAVESIKAFFGKLLNPKQYTAANYETGELSHNSGAELWYMLEREASEGNIKRTLYVTPEQKDTVYSYAFERTDGTFNYRYDIEVVMQNQAGGTNITNVSVSKVTSAAAGYVTDIPLTYMTGTVGSNILDPLDSYMNLAPGADPNLASALDVYDETYIFEAKGELSYNWNSEATDFSDIGAKRYAVKDYRYYMLTADDLKTEERKVGEREVIDVPGVDANGDGDFDDEGDTPPTYKTEDIKETRTMFEWDNDGWELVGSPAAGDRAVLKAKDAAEDTYKAAVVGYYQAIDAADMTTEESAGTVRYTKLISGAEKYSFIASDNRGEQLLPYTVPDGFTEVAFTGNPEKDARYVIISGTDGTGETVYKVLLGDAITWQDCTAAGNFVKATVQVYEVKYTQVAGDPDGFTLNWDGFALGSNVDQDTNTATTIITKQANPAPNEVIDVGAGYEYQNAGDTITFKTIPITSPIYFAWADGVKADAYYKGGVCYATISMPQSAVDYLYKNIVPTLCFKDVDGGGKDTELRLDWYSGLSPENPQVKFSVMQGLPEGCTVTATRKDSLAVGGEATYLIEIVTNQTEDKPLTLTFADGYSMDVYCATAASGNGVGVIDLHNVYKTTRYTKGELVETITTNEKGEAESKLLPLGKYIVRELTAPNGYVTSDNEWNVELKYKDQFTPLVWQDVTSLNEFVRVEIDLSKVFETAFESKTYVENGGATFGLYAGAEINSGKADTTSLKGKIPAGTLIDVITVDANGKAKSNIKLPYGTYYIKELTTLSTHKVDDKPYYFQLKETNTDTSTPCEFDYGTDGVSGNVVLDKYGQATITVKTEERLPMPTMKVGTREISLTDNLTEDGLAVKVNKDITTVKITAKDNVPVNITLPNGKTLTVTVKGNIYEYTLDGVTNTYTPDVSYTGYYACYEHEFTANTQPDFSPETETVEFKGAGTNANTVKAEITHTPTTTPETVWNDINGDGVKDPGEETIVLKPILKDGKQVYTHAAVFTVKDTADANAIVGDITRKSGNTESIEAVTDPDGKVTVEAGDIITLFDSQKAQISLLLDKDGKIKVDISNTLNEAVNEINSPEAKLNGVATTDNLQFVKSVTLARQDHTAKTLQIKVNSIDNLNVSPIKNDHLKIDTPPITPGSGKGSIIITKVDSKTGNVLSGAVFELWSAKTDGEGEAAKLVPDSLIETKTTGDDGKVSFVVDYGTYFYREISAPAGYVLDNDFYEITAKSTMAAQVTVTNQPEGSTLILSKVSTKGKPLAGAVFEIWSAKKVKGEYVKDKLITKATSDENGEIVVTGLKVGTYFYREKAAPAGYVTNGKYHLFRVKTDGEYIRKSVVNKKKGTIEVIGEIKPDEEDNGNVGLNSNVPKTGDTQSLWLYIGLALVALILSLLMLRKKNN